MTLMSTSWVAKLFTERNALAMAFLILSAEKGSRLPLRLMMYSWSIKGLRFWLLIKTAQGEVTQISALSFALSPESHEHGFRQVFWLAPAFLRLPDPWKSQWHLGGGAKPELTATGIAADSHSVPFSSVQNLNRCKGTISFFGIKTPLK